MTLYLAGLLVMVALVGREAWQDKTRKLTLPFWASRRTVAERRESVVVIRGGRAPADSLRSGVSLNGD